LKSEYNIHIENEKRNKFSVSEFKSCESMIKSRKDNLTKR